MLQSAFKRKIEKNLLQITQIENDEKKIETKTYRW